MSKKAKVTISGFGKARDELLSFINRQIKDEAFIKKEIGDYTRSQIQGRTRRGLEEYKQTKTLKPLSVEVRKILDKTEYTHPAYGPTKPTLTFTGQLLDSIRYTILRFIGQRIEVKFYLDDARTPYKTLSKPEVERIYYDILDKDRNATNSKRADPRTKLKLTALFVAQNQKQTTNNEIATDLRKRGWRFMFISTELKTQLESKIAQGLRKSLNVYRQLRRKSK